MMQNKEDGPMQRALHQIERRGNELINLFLSVDFVHACSFEKVRLTILCIFTTKCLQISAEGTI